jgi:ribosomal protein S21
MSHPTNLEVTLPANLRPAVENNELLIRKFLKACSKENMLKEISEKNYHCKRYEKPSVQRRARKLKYRKNMREREAKLKQALDFLENNKKRVK